MGSLIFNTDYSLFLLDSCLILGATSDQEDKEKCNEDNFYKFFNPASMFNINFKNCLMVVGRYIANLFLDIYEKIENWTAKVIHMILRVRQKIRPGRSFPRQSGSVALKISV